MFIFAGNADDFVASSTSHDDAALQVDVIQSFAHTIFRVCFCCPVRCSAFGRSLCHNFACALSAQPYTHSSSSCVHAMPTHAQANAKPVCTHHFKVNPKLVSFSNHQFQNFLNKYLICVLIPIRFFIQPSPWDGVPSTSLVWLAG